MAESSGRVNDSSSRIEEVEDEEEFSEIVLFKVNECYVYKIPPRKSSASHRADEWDVNKWIWEGSLKVISRGADCQIVLLDKSNGQLFAQASVKEKEPLPIEQVIDSSRYFVLKIDDPSTGRHAFIGLGFRERTQAYDFQVALHDHISYLSRKKEAESMEKEFKERESVDYSLKEGQKIHLEIKNSLKPKRDTSFVQKKLHQKVMPVIQIGSGGSPNLKIFVPPPPPSPSAALAMVISPDSKATRVDVDAQSDEVEDFGDFQAA